jgi:hypothetical protein
LLAKWVYTLVYNSSMYESDLTITTSPLTSSAQPYYWLATDPTTKTRQRNKEKQKGKRTGED